MEYKLISKVAGAGGKNEERLFLTFAVDRRHITKIKISLNYNNLTTILRGVREVIMCTVITL